MKTVITSTGNNIDADFDKRFGRASWFCVYDEDNDKTEFVKNDFAEEPHAAGTKVASLMVELGVKKIISGDFGPKAKELLEKFEIQMVLFQEVTTVNAIVEKLKNK